MKRKQQQQSDGGAGVLLLAIVGACLYAGYHNLTIDDRMAEERAAVAMMQEEAARAAHLVPVAEEKAKPVVLTRAESEPNDNTAVCQRIVDKHFVVAVMKQESGGRPNAVGDGGKAIGLMQLHAPAASECGVIDRLDPIQNVDCGTKYLMKLCRQFGTEERTLWA